MSFFLSFFCVQFLLLSFFGFLFVLCWVSSSFYFSLLLFVCYFYFLVRLGFFSFFSFLFSSLPGSLADAPQTYFSTVQNLHSRIAS